MKVCIDMQSNLLNTSITIGLWVFVIFKMNIEVEVGKIGFEGIKH